MRNYAGTFETDIDWSTGIGLPVLLQGTWNLQPSVSVVNKTGGAYLVRSPYSGGAFVSQGKRLGYNLSVSPTFFGLFGGIGPVARFRHSISPSISWSYSPASTIPEAYARAISTNDSVINTHIPASQTLSFGLTQNLEAKLRPPPLPAGDTSKAAADSAAPRARAGRSSCCPSRPAGSPSTSSRPSARATPAGPRARSPTRSARTCSPTSASRPPTISSRAPSERPARGSIRT